jgi:diguanylate cyclase (GGDEF)-like protein
MSLIRRLRGTSLLTRFAAISLLVTLAVGGVLSTVLSTVIEDRARQQAEDAALMAVRLGLQPQVSREDLAGGFAAERLAAVGAAVDAASEEFGSGGNALAAFDPIELKIFGGDRTILYHSESPELVGETSRSGELRAALDGHVVSGFAHSADDGDGSEDGERQLLEVYVPLQYDGVARPDGAIELYLPYAPVAAAVRDDVRDMTIALGVSLALFYAVVFRLIASASQRLRRQAAALRASAERDRHQSTHDTLTGLPNWVLLEDRLQQSLASAGRSREEVALLLIDLDRFKEINDGLGHSDGDKLLCQVGPRLQSVLREGDTVGRLGGDEFAVLLPAVDGAAEAQAVAERLREALDKPFDVDGVVLDV